METDLAAQNYPFFSFTNQYSQNRHSVFKTISYSHNKQMLKLMRLDYVQLSREREGFEPLSFLKSKNWANYLRSFLEFLNYNSKNGVKISREALYLKNNLDEIVAGDFYFYKKNILVKKRALLGMSLDFQIRS